MRLLATRVKTYLPSSGTCGGKHAGLHAEDELVAGPAVRAAPVLRAARGLATRSEFGQWVLRGIILVEHVAGFKSCGLAVARADVPAAFERHDELRCVRTDGRRETTRRWRETLRQYARGRSAKDFLLLLG